MQSTMTEKEYVTNFERIYGATYTGANLRAIVTQAARDAGLEFAPEPERLPERLVAEVDLPRASGFCCWLDEKGKRVLDLSLSLARPEMMAQVEIVNAAFAKANAYPGLRGPAQRLAELITPSVQMVGGEIPELRSALADLRVALAKGPK